MTRDSSTHGTDGWWFSAVFEAFSYLEDEFGYKLEVARQHFRGDYVTFSGPVWDLVISHDPDDTGHVGAELWVHADRVPEVEHPRVIAVNDLVHARQPSLRLPDTRRANLARAAVLDAIETWAVALREFAPDVLRGAWPEGVPVHHPW